MQANTPAEAARRPGPGLLALPAFAGQRLVNWPFGSRSPGVELAHDEDHGHPCRTSVAPDFPGLDVQYLGDPFQGRSVRLLDLAGLDPSDLLGAGRVQQPTTLSPRNSSTMDSLVLERAACDVPIDQIGHSGGAARTALLRAVDDARP